MKIVSERAGFKMLCYHAKNCDIHFLPKKDSFFGRKRVELLHRNIISCKKRFKIKCIPYITFSF